MATKIKPLGDRVIISPIEPKEVIKGGIIIPDSAKEKPMQGKVVAARCKTALKKDDIIIILRHLRFFVKIKILRILYFFSV